MGVVKLRKYSALFNVQRATTNHTKRLSSISAHLIIFCGNFGRDSTYHFVVDFVEVYFANFVDYILILKCNEAETCGNGKWTLLMHRIEFGSSLYFFFALRFCLALSRCEMSDLAFYLCINTCSWSCRCSAPKTSAYETRLASILALSAVCTDTSKGQIAIEHYVTRPIGLYRRTLCSFCIALGRTFKPPQIRNKAKFAWAPATYRTKPDYVNYYYTLLWNEVS